MRVDWHRRLGSLRRRWSKANPLFDGDWYVSAYPDVRGFGYKALDHYREHGAIEGRDPNPYFSTDWYLHHYPDVALAGWNPLDHYLRVGAAEGRDPSPLFDTDWYLEHNPDVKHSGMNPLLHYLSHGMHEGRLPRPPGGHERGLGNGAREPSAFTSVPEGGSRLARILRRPPGPDLRGSQAIDRLLELYRNAPVQLLHPCGYAYDNPDVADYGGDALLHYAAVGRHRGATPHPLFDPDWYARRYPDVRSARADPYAHFLWVGLAQHRQPSVAVDPSSLNPTHARLRFRTPDRERVTVIVTAYGNFSATYRCLYALATRLAGERGVSVVLADDRPDRPLGPMLTEISGLHYGVNDENLGYLRTANRAAARAASDYLVFLNNDAVVEHGWLDALCRVADDDPRVGMVGSMLLRPDGRLEEAGGIMFRDGKGYPYGSGDDPSKPEYNFVRDVDCVRGASLLVRRAAFEAVGGFDDRYAPAFFEEFDLAFKLREAGYRVVYQPASRVHHAGARSYGRGLQGRLSATNHQKFVARWANELARRPAQSSDLYAARERAHARGTILVADEHVPEYDRSAGGLAIWQYLELLRREDFKVVFVPHDGSVAEPYASRLQQAGIEVVPGFQEARRWLRAYGHHVEWAICARPRVATDLVPLIRAATRARLIYFTVDLHFLREMRHAELDSRPEIRRRAKLLRRQELAVFRSVDVVLTPSNAEAQLIRELAPNIKPYVIPLLMVPPDDGNRSAGSPPASERRDIIFVGGFRHQPNVDAATHLVQDIMPLVWRSLPHARLWLVGSDPPSVVQELASGLVEVTGYVPDLAPFYARARVSVSPLRYGAGVKGKIIGSLAAGVPVVTTPMGNEGIDLEDGVNALIATDAEELALATVRLLRDATLAQSLADVGRATVRERFSQAAARQALFEALGVPGSGANDVIAFSR
ncbi:MAG: glycosyltransferase [Candidatus Limnocylindrales bacterium]